MLKTGTSILGIKCTDGVVLAADRQVSAGTLVVGKNYNKVIALNDSLLAAITGGVADAQLLMRIVAAELRLKELKSKQKATVKESASLIAYMTFRNIRQPSMVPAIVGSLVAGINPKGGAELYTIEPAGAVSIVTDYDANFSSGMPYMLGVLERNYKQGMNVKQGVQLAIECLKASTQRDMGSGYGIDIYTLTKDGVKKVISQEIKAVFE